MGKLKDRARKRAQSRLDIGALKRAMLVHGGESFYESDTELADNISRTLARVYLSHATFTDDANATLVGGPEQHCLPNSQRIVSERDDATLRVGFALADDRWYIHAWVALDDGSLIEPTPHARQGYWGVPVDTRTMAAYG